MKNGKLMVAPAMLWLSIFFVIPLLIVVAVSFAGRTPYGQIIFEFTLKNYLRFLEPLYLQIFADTLIVAVITTVATTTRWHISLHACLKNGSSRG